MTMMDRTEMPEQNKKLEISIRKISPNDGDILVVTVPDSRYSYSELEQLFNNIHQTVLINHSSNVGLIVSSDDLSMQFADSVTLNKLGWTRKK